MTVEEGASSLLAPRDTDVHALTLRRAAFSVGRRAPVHAARGWMGTAEPKSVNTLGLAPHGITHVSVRTSVCTRAGGCVRRGSGEGARGFGGRLRARRAERGGCTRLLCGRAWPQSP